MTTKKTSPTKVAPASLESVTAHLGAVAAAELTRRGGAFDPRFQGSSAELRQLLALREYPAHEAVFAFDARYGGLMVPEAPGQAGFDWIFGAFNCLSGGGHTDPRGGRGREGRHALVPVVYSPNDAIFFLDGDGRAFADDTIAGTELQPFARDGDVLVARLLVFQRATALRLQHTSVAMPGLHGKALAEKFGLIQIAQATDELSSAWAGSETIVIEYRVGPATPSTVVWGADAK